MNVYAYLKAVHSTHGPPDPRAREVLTQLALHRNKQTGQCDPGTRRLTEQSTMSRNTVKAKLDDLETDGWIRRTLMKRGGKHGARTQYDLMVPAIATPTEGEKRATQADPLPPPPSGSGKVARSDDESGSISGGKRVSSGPERVKIEAQAGQVGCAGTVGNSSEEQLTTTDSSTEDVNGVADRGEFDDDRIARAARAVAWPGWSDRWKARMGQDPDWLILAEGLRHLVDTKPDATGWGRGHLFTLDVFDRFPDVREKARSAWYTQQDQIRRNGAGNIGTAG